MVAKQANASSVLPDSTSQPGRAPEQYALASCAFTNESSIFKVHKRPHSFCDLTLAENADWAERAETSPMEPSPWTASSVATQSSQTKFPKVCGLVVLGRQELVHFRRNMSLLRSIIYWCPADRTISGRSIRSSQKFQRRHQMQHQSFFSKYTKLHLQLGHTTQQALKKSVYCFT